MCGHSFGAEDFRLGSCTVGLPENYIVTSKNFTGTAETGLYAELFLRATSGDQLIHLYEQDLRGLPSIEKAARKSFGGGQLMTSDEDWLPSKEATSQKYKLASGLEVLCALEPSKVSSLFSLREPLIYSGRSRWPNELRTARMAA
ncbi:hypothetical protein [Rhizobacter sp. Root1238]|uniref:hypothetical protein n=1 Tax=Rhizobacter sp. Root1238 TaxID=1736435 RepID=UPI001F1E13FC|nr:hypothetical protein [Rhizobacter sp. Root1238]